MNRLKGISAALLVMFGFQVAATAGEGARFWQLQNRLRVEYDDNVRQQSSGESDSVKIIETIEFQANFNLENTFIGLSYSPSFTYWDDRAEDDSDVHHYLNLSLNHQFSPRLSVSVKDTFLVAELPELVERGSTLREENDYMQNDLNGDVVVALTPATRLAVSGRYLTLMYDDSETADREDYDLAVAGLSLSQQLKPSTRVSADLRYEMIAYDAADNRDSDTVSVGVGAEQTFSPNLLGAGRVGYSMKSFDSAIASDADSPYADVSLTFLPSPATRISSGVGYSLFEAGVFPYVNQERLRVFASIAHDLTARIGLGLSASYTDGQYNGDEVAAATESEDGSEEALLVSASANYQINRSNSVELSYQFTDFSSDLTGREDYSRNRVSVGWKTRL